MARIPVNLARVPNLLSTSLLQQSITSTNVEMLRLQEKLASGKEINHSTDDPVRSSLINVLRERIAGSDQRLRNFEHATTSLATVDSTLSSVSDLLLEARETASSQVGVGSSADSRASQAVVINSIISELEFALNSEFADLHVFGGTRTGSPPIESFFGGYRYRGEGRGIVTEIGNGLDTPITIGADEAVGGLASRIDGTRDLNPELTGQTNLQSIRGGRNAGVTLGQIEIAITGGGNPTLVVDLSNASSIGDVQDTIESAIRAAEPGALAGAYPTGVGLDGAGQRFSFNVNAGFSIDINDVGGGTTAADLGLDAFTYDNANPDNPAVDLDPRLTEFTRLGDLNPVTPFAAGDIVFNNGGRVGTVTVTNATTVAEFQRAVEALDLGIRIEIAPDERTLSVVNEISGSLLAVEESGGGTLTATSLGIRSFSASTPTSVFNSGRGVSIADGEIDPISGLPDPARNVDFEVTLTDGTQFVVDFTPADLADVGTILARINADAAGAGVPVGGGAGQFQAVLVDGANGIVFEDRLGGPDPVSVLSLNGHAAEDLGLQSGVYTPGVPATFAGEDRAKLRVDGLFSALIDLREALLANDERGINFAGGFLEEEVERLATARATVGARASRVEAAQTREEDSQLLDASVRSSLEDLDFVKATSDFALLQLVQQAGYRTAGLSQQISLLDFLR